jgi:hypothetical protein
MNALAVWLSRGFEMIPTSGFVPRETKMKLKNVEKNSTGML